MTRSAGIEQENDKAFRDGKRPAVAEPLLSVRGILSTESFISAASFKKRRKY
jgi:DNA-directed RNA polymerase subunit beta'